MPAAPNSLETVTRVEPNRSGSLLFQLTSRHTNPVLSSELATLAHDADIFVPNTYHLYGIYVEHRKSSPCQVAFNRSFGELSSKRGGNRHRDGSAYLASIVTANLKTRS